MKEKLMPTNVRDLQLRALEATRACPIMDTRWVTQDPDTGLDTGSETECGRCKGSGRVSILDTTELRVKCQDEFCLDGMDRGAPSLYKCRSCQGLGWTPNPDMAAWIECIRQMNWKLIVIGANDKGLCVVNIKPYGGYIEYVANESTFCAAVCSAIVQAAEAIQNGLGNES